MPQEFETIVRIMPPAANAEALANIQHDRDVERQERLIANLAIDAAFEQVAFDNTPYICGDVCPMENVHDATAFDMLRQYRKGLFTEREVTAIPYGKYIIECLGMQKSGDCLFSKD